MPFGLLGILVGMFPLTQITSETDYWKIMLALFVMGLGMGATMMPMFTSALKTLSTRRLRAAPRCSTSRSRSPARSASP